MVFGMCKNCTGWVLLVLGALVLLNEYQSWFTWAAFLGWILVVKGILGAFIPNNCAGCNGETVKRKKR